MRPQRFKNPWPHDDHGILDILKWKLGITPKDAAWRADIPNTPAAYAVLNPLDIATPPAEGWRAVWLGHASFLLQGAGVSLLIDPIFSDHCSPWPFPSLRRLAPTPCRIEDLPPIDAVLLTHTHYDHLDLPTLNQLGKETRLFVAEGHAAWLRQKGCKQVTELKWQETIDVTPLIKLTATPAQHFTARSPWDRDRGHWCGWLIEGAGCKLWHAGDSGYCAAFKTLGEQFGPIDFGMIPIGAYQPRLIMKPMHLNPEEAAQAFLDARCRRAVGMHWGTFKLTDEALGEPPLWLQSATGTLGIPSGKFTTGAIGQAWKISAHKP